MNTRRTIAFVLITFLGSAVVATTLIWRLEQYRLKVYRAEVSETAGNNAHNLQVSIERALSATHALAALVRQGKGTVPDFDVIGRQMLDLYPGVSNLQLSPNGIVTQVVPLQGNEKVIGLDQLKDPVRTKEAFIAKDTGKLTIAGPFDLLQGGLGAVGRLPVFLADAKGNSVFWGFTVVLIRFPDVLEAANIKQLVNRGLKYELWRMHPDTGKKQIIAATSSTVLRDPVEHSVDLPNGTWTLSVAPNNGWSEPLGLTIKLLLGLLFSLMLAYLAKLMMELKAHKLGLEEIVDQRTVQLRQEIMERKLVEEALLALKDELQEQNEELQVNEEELRGQNDHLLATEEMLQVQVEEYETSQKLLKSSEEQSRNNSQLLQNVIEHFPGVVFWKNTALLYLGCNKTFSDAAGLMGPDEIVGKSDYDMPWAETEASHYRDNDQHVIDSGEAQLHIVETQHQADGRTAWFDTSKVPLSDNQGNVFGILGASFDITEHKLAEELLLKTRTLYAETEKIGNVGGWEFDIDTQEQSWTEEVYRIHEVDFNFKPTVSEGVNFYTPSSRPIIEQAVLRAIELGEPFDVELEIVTAKGNLRSVHAIGKADLEHRRVYGFFQNITDRKIADEELKNNERRMASLLDISQYPFTSEQEFLDHALNEVIRLTNSKIGYIYFYSEQKQQFTLNTWSNEVMKECCVVEQQTIYDLDRTGIWGEAVRQRQPILINDFQSDHPLKKGVPDGHVLLKRFLTVPVFIDGAIVAVVAVANKESDYHSSDVMQLTLFMDSVWKIAANKRVVEEKLALEHQFHQAQKLESLGVLAGGIAHDFNNILTVIMGHCYMARMNMIPEQEYKAIFLKMETAGQRATDLCRQMLTYAGKSPMEQTRVNLWLLVDEVVKMLQAAIKKNVTIELDLKRDVPEINGDSAQIQQIVMNLIINSADAIGDKNGTIRVVLTKTVFEADQTETDTFGTVIQAGRYACLEVTDTGCGMDEETQKRIFEPFFTTKFTGRGLGMSAIHGIIKSHEAILRLISQPGVGTTFKVFFPIPKASDYAATASKATVLTKAASGTILFVEDEDLLRIMGKELLEALGFSGITASNGSAALEIYRERSNEINVILMDLIMPVMGGIEAYQELRKINPTVPIIICSGYGVESVEEVLKNDPHAGFVHKPYKPDELRDVLMRRMESEG